MVCPEFLFAKKDIFLKFIKLFWDMACLSYRREVKRSLKDRLIQWFICLIKWDMESFNENKREKQKLYESIKEKVKR